MYNNTVDLVNEQHKQEFDSYFKEIEKQELKEKQKIKQYWEEVGEAYATVHKLYNQPEDEEYIEGMKKLAQQFNKEKND